MGDVKALDALRQACEVERALQAFDGCLGGASLALLVLEGLSPGGNLKQLIVFDCSNRLLPGLQVNQVITLTLQHRV